MAREGEVAVVTGATSGVGNAIARALAVEGRVLHLVGRDPERLQAAARDVAQAGARVRCHEADLAGDEEVDALGRRLLEDCDALHVLVHSAGVFCAGRVDEASGEAFDRQYRVNVRAPYLITQRLLAPLRAAEGQIVFINSSAGLSARAGVAQYAATKHALKAVADSVREEVNPAGVRVLTVFLGRTATPMQVEIHRVEGRPYDPASLIQPEDVASVVLHALDLPRTVEITEISIRPLKKSGLEGRV